jgi:hypothetical protein
MQINLVVTELLIVAGASVGFDLQALSQKSPLLLVGGNHA